MNTLAVGPLRLEPQVAGHAPEMFEVLRDPAIYAFENEPPPSLEWLERRYRQLETRRSPDGSERWLNWVIRLPSGRLAGYVQATVLRESTAFIAYELASGFWRQGIGSAAVSAVLQELVSAYEVHACLAVFKARNVRSESLLRHLGFAYEPPEGLAPVPVEPDERVMYKQVSDRTSAARVRGPVTRTSRDKTFAHHARPGEANMPAGTVRLHRVLRATPERVYRAFLDPDAMAKWLPPHGFIGKVSHMDARVGGSYRMSFTNFATGQSHAFGGRYLELVPSELLRYTDRFDDPNLPGEMTTTVRLTKVPCGTELQVVQEGIPAVIPIEACYLGWQESLALLAMLVEAEIPD